MNKYGIENFSIIQVEQVDDINKLSEREIYWIKFYNTFYEGYNMTLGGDGTILYDYNQIEQMLRQGIDTTTISKTIGCCHDTVIKVAKNCNLPLVVRNNFIDKSKYVVQYDKNGQRLNEFNSYAEAARWLYDNKYVSYINGGVRSHIGEVCKGKRKSAYGFIWKNN